MKINMYMLRDYLSECILAESHLVSNLNEYNLEDVLLYQPGRHISPRFIYLIAEKYLAEFGQSSLSGSFIFQNHTPPQNITPSADYLVIQNDNIAEIMAEIQEVFRTFREWELQMFQLLNSHASLKQIAATALPFLYNPICMDTASLLTVFGVERNKPENLRILFDTDEGKYESDELFEAFRIDPVYKQSVEMIEPAIFPADILGYRILYYNIRVNGIYVTRLMSLEFDRGIKDSDFAIIKILASFIKEGMRNEKIDLNQHPRHFEANIRQLLQGLQPDHGILEAVLEQYNWKIHDRYFCIYIPGTQYDEGLETTTTLANRLERNYAGSAVMKQDNALLLIINLSIINKSRDDVLSRLIYDIRECLLICGVGLEFHDITTIASYYRQAQQAYFLGVKHDPSIWLHRYEAYALASMMEKITEDNSAESYIPEGLRKLIAYDKCHGTAFTRSLRVYLENNMHVTASTRELFLQRATFIYHLKRIQEISGLNLNNKEERLYLQIVFNLCYREKLPELL